MCGTLYRHGGGFSVLYDGFSFMYGGGFSKLSGGGFSILYGGGISLMCENFDALGSFSEQATESSHRDFKKNTWEKHNFKRLIGHPTYAGNLLRAVVVYNSTHV